LRRYRGAIAIAVVFLALLLVVLLTQPKNDAVTTAAVTPTVSAEQLKLQILNVPGPNRLEIKQTQPEKSAVYKLDGNWKLDGKETLELDSATLASTASQLSTLSGTQLVDENATNLATFGLDKPSLLITLGSPNLTKTLQVGITNPVTGAYYVKLSDANKVWSLNPTLVTQLQKWAGEPPLAPPTPTPLPTLPPTDTPAPSGTGGGTPAATTGGTTPTVPPPTPTAAATPEPTKTP
jgi:hypothetical protein